MKNLASHITLLFSLFLSSLATAQEPADVSKSAFDLQTQGRYVEMIGLYDPVAITEISDSIKDLIRKEKKIDKESKALFETAFGTSNTKKILALSSQETIGKLFAYIFSVSLSEEELALLRSATFSHSRTEITGAETAIVFYDITFRGENGSFTKEKQMNMKLVDGAWFVTFDASYNKAIRSIFGI